MFSGFMSLWMMFLSSKYAKASMIEVYLQHPPSHGGYRFGRNFALFVADQCLQAFARVKLAQTVDVVIAFVDLKNLEDVRMTDFSHHLDFVEKTLLVRRTTTLSNLS